jgi:hypothetical protein
VKKDPSVDANAPSDTNTKVKPITNCKDPINLVFVSFLLKENTDRKPGTKGKTHGEKKDRMPKKKAINMFNSITLIYTTNIFIKIYYL